MPRNKENGLNLGVKRDDVSGQAYCLESGDAAQGNYRNKLEAMLRQAIENGGKSPIVPLFIWGEPASGKTYAIHKLQEILKKEFITEEQYFLTTSIEFSYLLSAQRINGDIGSIIQQWRQIPYLFLDDIQDLCGLENAQRELKLILDYRVREEKFTLVCGNQPPMKLQGIDSILISRFGEGMTLKVDSPGYLTRLNILKECLDVKAKEIPDDVMKFVAQIPEVRKMLGALKSLIWNCEFNRIPVDMESARIYCRDMTSFGEMRILTTDMILRAVSKLTGVAIREICGEERRREVVLARRMAVHLCVTQIPGITFEKVGVLLGKRNYTTILREYNKINEELRNNQELKNNIEMIKRELI
jgi:chromosomal replication initiator protein